MMQQLRAWIFGLVGAALFCAVVSELTPEGRTKSVQRLLCGIVMTLSLISPLLDFDFESYAVNLSRYRVEAEAVAAGTGEISNSLSRMFIEEDIEAYILDKAQELGCGLSQVEVELQWSTEGCWYPVSARLTGQYNSQLSGLIEAELGIGQKRQDWSGDENNISQ